MTAATQFKIIDILEPSLGREKASEFTKQSEEIIEEKYQSQNHILATKEDVNKLQLSTKEEITKLGDKLESRIWAAFITIVVMILGLYATIIFKH